MTEAAAQTHENSSDPQNPAVKTQLVKIYRHMKEAHDIVAGQHRAGGTEDGAYDTFCRACVMAQDVLHEIYPSEIPAPNNGHPDRHGPPRLISALQSLDNVFAAIRDIDRSSYVRRINRGNLKKDGYDAQIAALVENMKELRAQLPQVILTPGSFVHTEEVLRSLNAQGRRA